MATNVFGNPVTNETVKLFHPDLKTITTKHRAEVALRHMNAKEKAKNVSEFVHNLKADYGNGTPTLCMIYNATGGDLTFVLNYIWEGAVWQSPYPQVIQNGQCAVFLEFRDKLIGNSKEAIVYRGQNYDGVGRDWMLAWNTPSMNHPNHVYADIRPVGDFASVNWDTIDSLLESQTNNYSTTKFGGFAFAWSDAGTIPVFFGIISLSGVEANFMAMASDVSSVVSKSLASKYVDHVDGAGDGARAA